MPKIRCTHVEVYVFRRRNRRPEFLGLRRAPGRPLAGVWQPVTGRIARGETAFAAARREVLEETGLTPGAWWCLESMTTYFDAASDSICMLPLFSAEIGAGEEVRLSDEHEEARFMSAGEAAKRYLWEAQRRGLAAVRREVLGDPKLADALALPAPRPLRARRATPARRRKRA